MSDNSLDPTTDFSINNKQYKLKIFLYKKGENPEDGIQIRASLVQTLAIMDALNNIFPVIGLSYDSRFGLNYERISVEDYYDDEYWRPVKPHYIFEGGGRDFIYIYLIEIPPEQPEAAKRQTNPVPVLDCKFVITKKEESVLRNVFDNTSGTITTLYMIPLAEWDLMLSYPQWTTGFDTKYQEKSGKKSGLCIKELLEKSNQQIDSENFDESGPLVNYTSIVNNSALDSIKKMYAMHMSEDDDCDVTILKYDHLNDKFTLKSIKKYIEADQINDKIGTFEQIILKNHANASNIPQVSNITPYATEITFDAESSLESITDNTPVCLVSRHKSTFVIDARQYNTREIENHIKDQYCDEPRFGDGMDTDLIINSFNSYENRPEQPIRLSKVPYWRNSERTSINRSLVKKKYFAGENIQLSVPGYGGARQAGRKFNIRMYAGAIDSFTRQILGTYLCTGLYTLISPRFNFYTNRIQGVKIFPAMEPCFSTQYLDEP